MSRPPPLARLLLRLTVPASLQEFVLGDLEEEFAQIARDQGPGAARRWYWRQAVVSAVRGRERRATPRRAVPTRGARLASVWQDARFAFRSFGRRPLFTAAALVTLALGVGATSAVFGIADAILFRPIPGVRDPGRLGIIWYGQGSPRDGISVARVSYRNLEDLNAQLNGFERLAGYQRGSVNVAAGAAQAERFISQFVTPSYFPVLGVQPVLGRTFAPEDDDAVRGGASVAVISHRLWIRLFDGASDVLGRTLHVNGLPFTVIGVLPEGFHGTERLDDVDLWFPGTTTPDVEHFPAGSVDYADRGSGGYYEFVARLAPDATWPDAEAELHAASKRLAELYPAVNEQFTEVRPFVFPGIGVMPLARGGTASTLRLLFGVVLLILLVACANVANLLLLRGVTRRGERAVRTAMGASRGRLVRQHLTENFLLWIGGGVAALAVAPLMVRVFHGTQLVAVKIEDVAMDWRVASFALGASVVTGLIFGTLPPVFTPRTQLVPVLKDAARSETGTRASLRSGLTVLQMATTVALLVSALLFVRSLLQLHRVTLGFEPAQAAAAVINASDQGYDDAQVAQYYRNLVDGLARSPAIAAAAVSTGVPLACCGHYDNVRRADAPDDATPIQSLRYEATAGYREVLGLTLLRGRWFTDDETLPPAARTDGVVVVSLELAERLFGGVDPIGRDVVFMGREERRARIVGVVGDVRWRELDGPMEPIVFEPLGQSGRIRGWAYLVTRSGTDGSPIPEMRRVARAIDATLPLSNETTLADVVRQQMSSRRVFADLLVLMGLLAVALAAVGLYGVVAFAVAARTREFGVRMAVGADAPNILWLVLRRGVVLVALGVAVGLGGAVALSKVFESRLFGVTSLDPASYVMATLVLVSVALAATLIPAHRATGVDPVEALRYE